MATNQTQMGLGCEVLGGVARLTLKQFETRNALSLGLLEELDTALDRIANDPKARVVVLGAEGPVFSSGHDLNELAHIDEAGASTLFSTCERVMLRLRQLPQPVIARVQGPAVAAGCQLVAACDLAVAVERATFSTPGVKIGLFCGTPMIPLVRAIPAKPAFEMLLTGQAISADRAFQLGLVNRVVPPEQLDAALQELVEVLLAFSPAVLRAGKAAFYGGLNLAESDAYAQATPLMVEHVTKPDAREGIAAFLEKRAPKWLEA